MFQKMTTNDLLKFLHQTRPDLVNDMHNADHNYDSLNLSPYHLEGSVMTHLMMVMNEADKLNVSPFAKVLALVHDLGKPLSLFKDDVKKRNFFIGHEGASCFLMIDLLKKLGLSNKEIEMAIFIVAHHTYLYRFMDESGLDESRLAKVKAHFTNNKETFNYLLELSEADNLGRFSLNPRLNMFEYFKKAQEEVNNSVIKNTDRSSCKYEFQVLIGPQASGKSSYAKEMKSKGFNVLCRDDVAEELYQKPYSELSTELLYAEEVDKLFEVKLQAHILNKDNLIIDKTNMTNKSQRRVFGQNKKGECFRKAIVFVKDYNLLKKHLNERYETTGKSIRSSSFKDTILNFQAPTYETFDEIEYKIFE